MAVIEVEVEPSVGAIELTPAPVFTAGTALETIELYEAAERVARSTNSDVWGAFARYCAAIGHAELAGEALKDAEREFKEKHDKAPLPNPYRSAKSVALTALTMMIPLVNPDGTARGKTAVQKDIADSKKAARAAEDATLGDGENAETPSGSGKDYLGVFLRAAANLKRHAWADLTMEQRQQALDAVNDWYQF